MEKQNLSNPKLSCSAFISGTSTSSIFNVRTPCSPGVELPAKEKAELSAKSESSPTCSYQFTTSSTSSSVSMKFFKTECTVVDAVQPEAPNINYELDIAKSILKKNSTLSGDNLFDHLADVIRRVMVERPPNVVDFFEEFSRNIREQKFHRPERYPTDFIYQETYLYRKAIKFMHSLKLPEHEKQGDLDDNIIKKSHARRKKKKRHIKCKNVVSEPLENPPLYTVFNNRVQHLQFCWHQCGLSIGTDDVYEIVCAMERLKKHPGILQCHFWGIIYGLKADYYIVEAQLTQEEINSRFEQMKKEVLEKSLPKNSNVQPTEDKNIPTHVGPELTPGVFGWENYPDEELNKMKPAAAPVPLIEVVEMFDVPPEPIGEGLNRYSYFVVNTLTEDWIELPVVTPKQIIISRHIRKFLTGSLENDMRSCPCFPGREKHYLRAMIARITCGTFIAPYGYYRKMSKREKRLYDGIVDEEDDTQGEQSTLVEEEEEELDSDIILLKNEFYAERPVTTLCNISEWVHVRPSILNQGRIVWFDEEKARKEREKELEKLLRMEMGLEEQSSDEQEDEANEEEEEEEEINRREYGPPILQACSFDYSDEYTLPWVSRLTSRYTNLSERMLVMNSNVWPGAHTFIHENICESIYIGWGHKYVARNLDFKHIPPIVDEYEHSPDDFLEVADPTVEEENEYRDWWLSKHMQQQSSDIREQTSEYEATELSLDSGKYY